MSYFKEFYESIKLPIDEKKKRGLRRSQIGAIHAIASHFTIRNEPAIVSMPTGSGKTAVLMLAAFFERAKRVLVVTPSRLVRNQIKEEFERLSTLRKIGVLDKNVPNPRVKEAETEITSLQLWNELEAYDVVVATPKCISPTFEDEKNRQAGKKSRNGKGDKADKKDEDTDMIKKIPAPPQNLFDLLLLDEAHHSPAKKWNRLLESFPTAKKVLFTAAPFRRDKREIKGRFVYSYSIKEAYKDKIFGKIQYIPVTIKGKASGDTAIAREAERVLKEDRDAGLKHFLMVRTDSKKRAEELKLIYSSTKLNLKLIHSGYPFKEIKGTIKQLKAGELDGIICVDMLGEGFDFPNLKVAAIHAPHKSLEVTLQFIGRFARTRRKSKEIGEAKFLAIPSEIKIEAKKLFDESAVWQDIVEDLSNKRIMIQKKIRETLRKFEESSVEHFDTKDLSLYSLTPYNHVKIYRVNVKDGIDFDKEINFPKNFEVVFWRKSRELSATIFITRERLKPRWTNLEMFYRSEYDLFIVYYHKSTKLLFINATRKIDTLYEEIAKQYSSNSYKSLSLCKVSRVLYGLKGYEFFNIGMKNRILNNNTESYRIIAGANAQMTLSTTDGRLYNRGHVFGAAEAISLR